MKLTLSARGISLSIRNFVPPNGGNRVLACLIMHDYLAMHGVINLAAAMQPLDGTLRCLSTSNAMMLAQVTRTNFLVAPKLSGKHSRTSQYKISTTV